MPESSNLHPYDRHVGRYGRALALGLIEFAAIGPGQRVLHVGCGTGQLTAELAAAVDGGENIAAVDVSDSVLSVCRAGVPNADIREASAEALPSPTASSTPSSPSWSSRIRERMARLAAGELGSIGRAAITPRTSQPALSGSA